MACVFSLFNGCIVIPMTGWLGRSWGIGGGAESSRCGCICTGLVAFTDEFVVVGIQR